MVAIQNFLASFGELFVSGFNLVLGMLRDFFDVLKLLTKVPTFVLSVFNWMPSEIMVYATCLISVVIIYKILGREG